MKESFARLGPIAVPLVAVRDFHRFPRDINFEEVWHIVGPSAAKNLVKCPLWIVICAAYLEGIQHAQGAIEVRGEE